MHAHDQRRMHVRGLSLATIAMACAFGCVNRRAQPSSPSGAKASNIPSPAVKTTIDKQPSPVDPDALPVNVPLYALTIVPSAIVLRPSVTQALSVSLDQAAAQAVRVFISPDRLPAGLEMFPDSLWLGPGESADFNIRALSDVPLDTTGLTVDSHGQFAHTQSFEVPISIILEDPEFVPEKIDLPILQIETDNGAAILDTDSYINGVVRIKTSQTSTTPALEQRMQIKGRGNTTWGMPKKPYRLKLTTKQSLLGMPSSKDWVLLASYSDKTLLRTRVGFALGQLMAMDWTPRMRQVEVFLNGRYDGVYQLTERIEVASQRVAIDKLSENDVGPDVISGGYLIEVDSLRDGPDVFVTPRGIPFVIKDPSPLPTAQFQYISDYVSAAETTLFSEGYVNPTTGYASQIDVDSFIHWYLVNEILKNADAAFGTSCFMYKPRHDKLLMGPLWDLDIGAGNANHGDPGSELPEGWHIRRALWFERLFSDPAFSARVQYRWNALKPHIDSLIASDIDQWANELAQAQANNFARWIILGHWVWPNVKVTGSFAGEVTYLKTWLAARVAWLDREFNR